ncbi:rhomboid family intramembrane serine protease, partial [Mycobacterium sp. ITM-2017-0098]
SWQGHLCGAVAGVLAAYLLSGPERKARERRQGGSANPYLTT